ncbi:zinc-dependent metalloprotease [Leeuwenhoekiella palythoae]|uniref:zinc-dependent metalloprotease n=1 Tax=Leeuwenhoekiella palythoae TaxID=573501 RepID=UPI001CE12022|nr:zinc-dependent metalloprotease [Leeuwenhoekiella palythoae]UBZ10233.1 zinc-dependent metalloprotease [Leeuwenhoekiella palythoae]
MKLKLYPIATFVLAMLTVNCASTKQKKKNASAATEEKQEKSKSDLKAYDKVITKEAISDSGLFTVHKVDEDYFYEIPDSLFNREMLMVTRIAKTATGIGFGGGKANTQVLRWEKKNKKVLLRVVSHEIFAADSLPIHEAVSNSNFEPVLFSFDVKTINKDSTATVVQVNDLFSDDVQALGLPGYYRESYKVRNVDKGRGYIESLKSFPLNIESRHVKTYNAGNPPSNESVGSITVEMSNSMVLLPKVPMERRYFDRRVGWFARGQVDYGLDAQESKTVRYLDRWRLEVKPEDEAKFKAGELVEPKKQIVYYIDRATPKKWIPFIKEGIEDWQVAFEAAGFKNAIIAKEAPTKEEDPDWSPEDVRYSTVRYLASPIPNANGPHVSDPRSGEILESDINWYHNVMTLLRNWYFVQTAAKNPEARGVAFKDKIMGRLIRFVSSHEVGHTLGLPHNMGSSVAYPVDSLRSKSFTDKYGTAPSIMDYARFNYVAQPGDGDVSMMPNIGVYDKYSIKWGYRPILDKEGMEEKPILDQWILEHAGDPLYRFGAQQWSVVDPSSQTEDLGDDAVKASNYGIENLKRIIPNLISWTSEDGKDYDDLETLYDQVLTQFNRYMGHVSNNIGGVYQYNKTYDQEGAVFIPVPKERQEESMQFLQDQLFTTPEWMIDNNILNKIENNGNVERIRGLQVRTLENVLDFGRLGRMIENETLNGKEAYTLTEMMNDLRSGIFSELRSGKKIDTYRRNLQRAYVDRLEHLLTEEQSGRRNATSVNVSQSDIRAIARAELNTLKRSVRSAIGRTGDTLSRYHLQDLMERIDLILDPR